MTKNGHYKTGAGMAMTCASLMLADRLPPVDVVLGLASAWASSSLPDTMEIKWWVAEERYSLIPHRTITHWLLPWVLGALLVWFRLISGDGSPLLAIAFGVSCGAIGHILMDWLTPMGVPVGINPFRRRSLYLYRSGGAGENVIAIITLVVGVICGALATGALFT